MTPHNWIQAARPKTLFAGVGPVLVGTGFVAHIGITPDPLTFALTLICTMLMQIGTNLANDYYDFMDNIDGPQRLGPARMSASGRIPPTAVKRGFQLCLLLAFLLGLFLIKQSNAHPLLLGVGILSIILAFAYSGGPFPLSRHALGEVAALVMFGPVAVWGSAALQLGPEFSSSLSALCWGLGPGMIAVSMMALNNLRDIQSDAASGKTTLATLMGEKIGRLLVLVPIVIASMVPMVGAWMTGDLSLALVGLIPLIFVPTWKRIIKGPVDARLNGCLAKIGIFLAIYCLTLSLLLAL